MPPARPAPRPGTRSPPPARGLPRPLRRWSTLRVLRLDPRRRRGRGAHDRELRAFHLVATLPDFLAPIVRDSSGGVAAFQRAVVRAIHLSWDRHAPEARERGDYSSRRKFSASFGAIFNLHPWGDERKNRQDPRKPEWPVWRPHFDVLLAGYRIKDGALAPLRETWPSLFRQTGNYYREALREEFLPLLGCVPLSKIEETRLLLASDFPAIIWVSTAGHGKYLQVGGQVVDRVEYSSRPLWEPSRVIVDRDAGEDIVVYPTQGGRARHRVPARLLFPELRALQDFVVGKEVHRYWGFLSKRPYAKTCALAGNKPARRNAHTGAQLVESYYPDERGEYDPLNQVFRPAAERGGSA